MEEQSDCKSKTVVDALESPNSVTELPPRASCQRSVLCQSKRTATQILQSPPVTRPIRLIVPPEVMTGFDKLARMRLIVPPDVMTGFDKLARMR